jgi:hypothetical protein
VNTKRDGEPRHRRWLALVLLGGLALVNYHVRELLAALALMAVVTVPVITVVVVWCRCYKEAVDVELVAVKAVPAAAAAVRAAGD